jgi:H+/Cl- antiporter ClcA
MKIKKNPFSRRTRAMLYPPRSWRPRLVFWLGALSVGVISVFFAWAADYAQTSFSALRTSGPWAWLWPLIVTPVGFVACSYLANRYFPNSQGSGIPQAIAARHLEADEERRWLLSPRSVLGKVLLTVIGLFSGASIGREGPTVQVGAAIMLAAGRIGGLPHAKGLILAGSAAGIAAAFNTPLAGVVFAIEEMSRSYQSRVNNLVLAAVVISGLAAYGMQGHYNYFGSSNVAPANLGEWMLTPICGVVGGALGACFSLLAVSLGQRLRRWAHPAPLRRWMLVSGVAGGLVAIIGVVSNGATFGTSYEVARGALAGEETGLFFFALKFAASLLSMMTNIPGGIFAPSLSVGAAFGSTVGALLGVNIGLAAVLGMTAYFAGVTQAPMTAFVIILEMTGNHDAIIPIMAVAMLGFLTSRLLAPHPLYHSLSRVYLAAVLRQRRGSGQG